jgi:hypothetical protein
MRTLFAYAHFRLIHKIMQVRKTYPSEFRLIIVKVSHGGPETLHRFPKAPDRHPQDFLQPNPWPLRHERPAFRNNGNCAAYPPPLGSLQKSATLPHVSHSLSCNGQIPVVPREDVPRLFLSSESLVISQDAAPLLLRGQAPETTCPHTAPRVRET